jgi:hypothetical protein
MRDMVVIDAQQTGELAGVSLGRGVWWGLAPLLEIPGFHRLHNQRRGLAAVPGPLPSQSVGEESAPSPIDVARGSAAASLQSRNTRPRRLESGPHALAARVPLGSSDLRRRASSPSVHRQSEPSIWRQRTSGGFTVNQALGDPADVTY